MNTFPLQSIEFLKYIIENAYAFGLASLAIVVMIMVTWFMFNSLRKLDLRTLFISDEPGNNNVSASKFWSFVAYLLASIAFMYINFVAPAAATLEFVWLIYLTVIAGAGLLSKFIGARYGINTSEQSYVDPPKKSVVSETKITTEVTTPEKTP